MNILNDVACAAKVEVKKLVKYWQTYPKIDSGVELCAYHRKRNKAVPSRLLAITAALILIQILRISLTLLRLQSFSIAKVLPVWITIDIFCISASFYGIYLKQIACSAQHRNNLSSQLSVRFYLHICRILPPAGTLWIGYNLIMSPGCASNLIWIVSFMLEVYSCVALIDGILGQAVVITIYNSLICWMIHTSEVVNERYLIQVFIPVMVAIFFFVLYDRYDTENFILRRLVKSQKKVYEDFLKKIRDPTIILNQDKLLFYNEAAKREIGITNDNFYQRIGNIVSISGNSLEDVVKGALNKNESSTSKDEIKQEKYFMHDDTSDLIQCDKVLMATIIVSTCLSRKKTLSLVLRDLTKELKQEEERIEAHYKNMLLFSLSHELRTPLNILQEVLSVAKKYRFSLEDNICFARGKSAWRYLRNKISDLLDYAQLMVGEFALHSQKFSIRKFVAYLRKMTQFLLQQKGEKVSLNFKVADTVEDILEIDKDRLEQVLFNLLLNAAKYTSEGEIMLEVAKGEKDMVSFSVSDTGCGMSEEMLKSLSNKNLFRPELAEFKSEEHSNQKKAKGSGLGLTVSRLICQRMGSGIQIRSLLGKGSTFKFDVRGNTRLTTLKSGEELIPEEGFKIKKRPTHQYHKGMLSCLPLPRTKSVSAQKPRRNTVTVLVVDDNEFNRSVVCRMINRCGLQVVEAENGEIAINKYKHLSEKTSQILILMDIDMPVMNGIESTKHIRKIPILHKPYICALTAFASESERKLALEAGMDRFLSKPLTKDNLLAVLKKLAFIP